MTDAGTAEDTQSGVLSIPLRGQFRAGEGENERLQKPGVSAGRRDGLKGEIL